jgi:hypothetical protein
VDFQPIHRRAEVILRIDDRLLVDGEGRLLVHGCGVARWEAMGQRLRDIAEVAAEAMSDVPDALSQVSIALRPWAGCLEAA